MDSVSVRAAIDIRPVAIAVDASNWSSYQGGIFSNCGSSINHAVVAIGYDVADNYYIIRNSWGNRWGEAGKMKLESGACGSNNYVYDLLL